MISEGYPYRYGEPIGWRSSLRAEIAYGVRQNSDKKYLDNNSDVYQEKSAASNLSKNVVTENKVTDSSSNVISNTSELPMAVDSEPEKPEVLSTPVIDLTLEDELGRMTLNENKVMIDIKNDPLNKFIPMPIEFVKQEPIEQPSMEIDGIVKEMEFENTLKDYNSAKKVYKGRYYESSITPNDVMCGKTSKIVLSTSTLNGVFQKDCYKGVNLIAAPSATVNALYKVAETELIASKACPTVNIVVCCGLNDFDRGHDLVRIKNDLHRLKQNIVRILPQAKCNFVKLPLPPVLCKLPDNRFITDKDRTVEILMFNDFSATLNDVNYDLSLQNEGIISPRISGYEYWITQDKTYGTGRAHDRAAWRRTEPMPKAMHLSDDVRKKFWKEVLGFYFEYMCE